MLKIVEHQFDASGKQLRVGDLPERFETRAEVERFVGKHMQESFKSLHFSSGYDDEHRYWWVRDNRDGSKIRFSIEGAEP